MLVYLIDGNEVNGIVNRVFLKVSVMDSNDLQVLGIHLGGIPLWISSEFCCQYIRLVCFRKIESLAYTIVSISRLPIPNLLVKIPTLNETAVKIWMQKYGPASRFERVFPRPACFDPFHDISGYSFLGNFGSSNPQEGGRGSTV